MSRTRFISYEKPRSGWVARGFGVPFLCLSALVPVVEPAVAWTEFPRKPIKVVVPFASGGASDTLVWSFKKAVQENELSRVPLVVVNVPGAGGTIGSRRVRNARPDGYTVLNLHDGIFTARASGLSRFGAEAFRPVAATGCSPTVVCVGPDAPWSQLERLLQEAREKPGTLRFGANPGAPSHFVGLQLEKAMEGARFRMVPAGGGAKRFSALLGGHLEVSIFSVSEYLQFREGGLRALALLDEERHPVLKAVPTGKERGVDVVAGTTHYWWVPEETPEDRITVLADLLQAAMDTDTIRSTFGRLSIEPVFLRGEELKEAVERERERYAGLAVSGEEYRTPLPRLAGLGAGAALLLLVAQRVWERRRAGSRTTHHGSAPDPDARRDAIRGAALPALLVAYVGLLGWGGMPYLLATALFLAAGVALLAGRPRQRWTGLGWAVGLALLLHLVFRHVLVIDLP